MSQFPKPRQIVINKEYRVYDDSMLIMVKLPMDRLKHANALTLVVDEIGAAIICEASRSFFIFDEQGNKLEVAS